MDYRTRRRKIKINTKFILRLIYNPGRLHHMMEPIFKQSVVGKPFQSITWWHVLLICLIEFDIISVNHLVACSFNLSD